MPVYLVTDTLSDLKVMVEADRPAGAIAAMVQDRFEVSTGLDAVAALGLAADGVRFIKVGRDHAQISPVDREPKIEDQPVDDDPDFAEVDEDPRQPLAAIFADDEETPIPFSDEAAETYEALR